MLQKESRPLKAKGNEIFEVASPMNKIILQSWIQQKKLIQGRKCNTMFLHEIQNLQKCIVLSQKVK